MYFFASILSVSLYVLGIGLLSIGGTLVVRLIEYKLKIGEYAHDTKLVAVISCIFMSLGVVVLVINSIFS